MKFTCELKLPNICESPLITREIEISASEMKKSDDLDRLIRLKFAHAISEEMVIDYKKI